MGDPIPPVPGDLFEGRYRIDATIGEGGFSRVYRATDTQTNQIVALKVLTSRADDSLADRFQREAQVLSALNENHIIRLYGHGRDPDGLLYMAFEYVEGRSLFEHLRDHGRMEAARVALVLQQICQALQAAHAQGILHRDIKPNNIMLRDDDYVKVLDFGIAKAFGQRAKPGQDLTAAGTLIGTPRYMSPEQIRGQAVGPPSDIYALGMVAIELLTGRKALPGRDRLEILEQQLSHSPNILPTDLNVPGKLRDIVERMTAKDLRIRYSSAAAVLRDLVHWNENVAEVDETMLATSQTPASMPVSPDGDSTVMHRINTRDLPLPAPQVSPSAKPEGFEEAPVTSQNFQAPQTDQAANPWAPQPQNASNSGTWPQASSSGSWPQAAASGSWPQASSSGSWPHAQPPVPSASSTWPQAAQSGQWVQARPPLVLTMAQKVILGVSLFVPGVAHLAFGQTKKGAIILIIFGLSLGTILIATLAFALDALLIVRAKRYREVGEFEFFPDYKEFFS